MCKMVIHCLLLKKNISMGIFVKKKIYKTLTKCNQYVYYIIPFCTGTYIM